MALYLKDNKVVKQVINSKLLIDTTLDGWHNSDYLRLQPPMYQCLLCLRRRSEVLVTRHKTEALVICGLDNYLKNVKLCSVVETLV